MTNLNYLVYKRWSLYEVIWPILKIMVGMETSSSGIMQRFIILKVLFKLDYHSKSDKKTVVSSHFFRRKYYSQFLDDRS